MLSALFIQSTGGHGFGPSPVPAIYRPAGVESRPPKFGVVGTGGVATANYYISALGYRAFRVLTTEKSAEQAQFTALMKEVKLGFGRTMNRLPEVFGVSRQTLYNWLDGDTPRPANQAKLQELAAAAQVFTQLGFKPTSSSLDRTVSQGKALLELIRDGANGAESAKKLVRIVKRGSDSRADLDDLLGGRKAKLTESDIGMQTFNESV